MRVWITRYALTRGILEADAEPPSSGASEMIVVEAGKFGPYKCYFHGADWHESREIAVARVRAMISAKRRALARTAAKLDRLESELF